jgi:hypothetical protein
VLRRIAALFAAAKPRFSRDAMSSTSGNSVSSMSTVPSLEALSTTQIRVGLDAGCADREARHLRTSSRERYETMTISSSGLVKSASVLPYVSPAAHRS